MGQNAGVVLTREESVLEKTKTWGVSFKYKALRRNLIAILGYSERNQKPFFSGVKGGQMAPILFHDYFHSVR